MARTRSQSKPRTVECAVCHATFQARHSQAKYCSPGCAREGERASWRRYGERNSAARSAYRRHHYAQNSAAIIARTKAYQRTPAGRRAQKVNDRRQREKFPEKYAARQAVLVALRAGRLQRKPCEDCGSQKAQAHHEDYSKPLVVRWLCDGCHKNEHRRHG